MDANPGDAPELAQSSPEQLDAVRPEPGTTDSDQPAHARDASDAASGDVGTRGSLAADGSGRAHGSVAEQLRARLADGRRRATDRGETLVAEGETADGGDHGGALDRVIVEQLGLSPVDARGVVEQLATVLPFALFVAVLLYTVYQLGMGAGRTIGRLERGAA
jgi:hypothetical protein